MAQYSRMAKLTNEKNSTARNRAFCALRDHRALFLKTYTNKTLTPFENVNQQGRSGARTDIAIASTLARDRF